jgi:transposase, IS30 family
MKKHYQHLTQHHRDRFEAMLLFGCKQSAIAKILKVSKSTISREVNRNCRKTRKVGGTINGKYQASVANHKAYLRRYWAKSIGRKINRNQELKNYVVTGLNNGWSPQEISGRISKTALYDWIYYNYQGQEYFWCLYSKRKKPKKRKDAKPKRTLIPHRIGLESRPLGATNKSRYGHWEGDTVVSGKKTGSKTALSVIYERKAKYVDIRKIRNLKPTSNNQAIEAMRAGVKAKSLSLDNGIENTKHTELSIPTFFCDPYSSWQKGGVENVIKMIRRYVPKGCDIREYSDQYLKKVVIKLNNKPRKSLDYQTPLEIMEKCGLFQ